MRSSRCRRRIVLTAALSCLAVALPAWAGSYLNRCALLLSQAGRDAEAVRVRLSDRELARVAHELATTRVRAASRMRVPPEVAQAHPHLLLVLENYERALAAAAEGEPPRFFVYLERARGEERTFHSVLKQLGWTLPEL
jgi:hypothetical protein